MKPSLISKHKKVYQIISDSKITEFTTKSEVLKHLEKNIDNINLYSVKKITGKLHMKLNRIQK